MSHTESRPLGGGMYLKLIDFNRRYESVSDKSIILNNFNMRDEDDRERLNNLLFSEYVDDVIDTTPSCECGRLKGEYNVSQNIRCVYCGTRVMTVTERPIESILWMQVPDGVRAFITPIAWTILNKQFNRIPRWLCDPTFKDRLTMDAMKVIQRFKDIGWQRSLNYFHDNFDLAMQILSDERFVTPASRRLRVEAFIAENKHLFFSQFLPIPNRTVFITEQTVYNKRRVDSVIFNAIDAVRTLGSLTSSITPVTQRVKENRTIKVSNQLSAYYTKYIDENLSGKPGIYRQHVFGSRLDYTGRAVITSISEPHLYNEVHLPWGLTILMYKAEITSKLLRRGYTPDESERFLMKYTRRYHPLLDEIFDELLNESIIREVYGHSLLKANLEKANGPYKKGSSSIIIQRNPSLKLGSAQKMQVTKIKKDPEINTISLSVLVLKAFNAD